jgi:chorismate dehydratase
VFRVASVAFLNALPLVDGLAADAGRHIELVCDLPSRLAGRLRSGAADVALLPVVECFRGGTGGIVPGIAIAADGPVTSVKLFTRVPPQALKAVAVDRGSQTSVALLRILLAELHGVRPAFHVVEPDPASLLDDVPAALVIGDRCLVADEILRARSAGDVQSFDLAALWKEFTGLPFVFAAWALSERIARGAPEVRDRLIELLVRARDRGLENLGAIAAREAAAPLWRAAAGLSQESLHRYLADSLRYTLGETELAGLQRFHGLCVTHGLAPASPPLRLVAVGKAG